MISYHKALSIRQPWASMIAAELKTIETRTWHTDYRGPIWIHAARRPDPIIRTLNPRILTPLAASAARIGWSEVFPTQAIIARADIIDCRRLSAADRPAACCDCDDLWGLVLADVRALPRPVPIAGALSFWQVPASLLPALQF